MDTEYAYASGKIKVLEKKFFNKQELAGLLEMSLTDIVGELENRGYPKIDKEKSAVENGEGIGFLEEMIDKHLDKAYNLVRELSLNPVVTNAFLFLNDGHNLKGLIKLKYVQEEKKENIFLKRGFFTEEELKKMIERNVFSAFPPGLRELPQKAITAYKHRKNPQRIDFILDVGFWEYFKNQTGENVFVNGIGQIRIDLINLVVFLRLKEKKEKKAILEHSLLFGGTIAKDKFLRNFSKQINDFINDIRFSPYKKMVR
ncbi:V-type ATPase subunit, partial [bacterium]|nr:V-type ATPase subunit [bacterium]